MNRELNLTMSEVYKYRSRLIESGKRVNFENPDNLSLDELQALTARIFKELNDLDMSLNFPPHDTGLRRPESVDKFRENEIFIDFLDWYNVIATPSNVILGYLKSKYPKNKYPRVVCVGDGEKCHLGRKLAGLGYTVVVVDPVSKKDFTMSKKEDGGMLRIVKGKFNEKSEDMINWSNVIVGAKVPECAESLASIKNRPTVFSISSNAEVHNMSFRGKPIRSSAELEREIEKMPRVKKIEHTDSFGMKSRFYEFDQKDHEERQI